MCIAKQEPQQLFGVGKGTPNGTAVLPSCKSRQVGDISSLSIASLAYCLRSEIQSDELIQFLVKSNKLQRAQRKRRGVELNRGPCRQSGAPPLGSLERHLASRSLFHDPHTTAEPWLTTSTSSSTTLEFPDVERSVPECARLASFGSHADLCPRPQFVRLYFEATGTPYVDTALTEGQSAVKPYLEGSFPGAGQSSKPRTSRTRPFGCRVSAT